jgi:hypothetical protein
MSLLEQQNLLARLYVDENLRRVFLSDPSGTAVKFGLSATETEDLRRVLPDELASFAESLTRKRMREVEKMLPLTRRTLEADFELLFLRYVEATPESQKMSRLDDVLSLCRYISHKTTGSKKETAEFERARIEFNSGRRNFVFKHFNGKYHIFLKLGSKRLRRAY